MPNRTVTTTLAATPWPAGTACSAQADVTRWEAPLANLQRVKGPELKLGRWLLDRGSCRYKHKSDRYSFVKQQRNGEVVH